MDEHMGCGQEAPALRGTFETGGEHPNGWQPAATLSPGASVNWCADQARSGRRAIEAHTPKAQAAWESAKIPVNASVPQRLDGWLRTSEGAAWLVLRYFDASGRCVDQWKSPRIKRGQSWTYVAVEAPSLGGDMPPYTAQVTLWVRGHAALDDVALNPMSQDILMNAGFEMPLDKKGRVPFWNPEEDARLFPGQRAGALTQEKDNPAAGQFALALKTEGDWYAITSIHYSVWDWTRSVYVPRQVQHMTLERLRVAAPSIRKTHRHLTNRPAVHTTHSRNVQQDLHRPPTNRKAPKSPQVNSPPDHVPRSTRPTPKIAHLLTYREDHLSSLKVRFHVLVAANPKAVV